MLRLNRKRNPKEVCETKLKKGEVTGTETENRVWMNKRAVLMIASKTEHSDVLTATGCKNNNDEKVLKPHAVLDYNSAKKKSGCIRSNVIILHVHQKTVKWNKKVFFEIILESTIEELSSKCT